jgi:hypothetical protein
LMVAPSLVVGDDSMNYMGHGWRVLRHIGLDLVPEVVEDALNLLERGA